MRLDWRFTGRGDGDAACRTDLGRIVSSLGLDPGRAVTAEQVHGAVVRRVGRDDAGRTIAGVDALWTPEPGLPLVVRGADCPLVLLLEPDGARVAVVHAGWRGLAAGVLQAAKEAIGPGPLVARLGPCAGPCCYEVGEDVAARFPAEAVRRVGDRRPRLDLPRAVELALGTPVDRSEGGCTVCDGRWHSWRRERTTRRNALIAWVAPVAS